MTRTCQYDDVDGLNDMHRIHQGDRCCRACGDAEHDWKSSYTILYKRALIRSPKLAGSRTLSGYGKSGPRMWLSPPSTTCYGQRCRWMTAILPKRSIRLSVGELCWPNSAVTPTPPLHAARRPRQVGCLQSTIQQSKRPPRVVWRELASNLIAELNRYSQRLIL